MTSHVNFYENLQEAQFRLRNTIVLYDGQPYSIIAITDHKIDNIFRVYMDEIGYDPNTPHVYPSPVNDLPAQHETLGPAMDKWLDANKSSKVIRKQMNSPLFGKFRPYPLGMCNTTRPIGNGRVWAGTVFVERVPSRHNEQGLTPQSVYNHAVSLSNDPASSGRIGGGGNVDIHSPAFRSCILADHPKADVCLTNLLDPKIENEAVAFHRYFALIRGPLDMIFLAYKQDIVGALPKSDFSSVKLGRKFGHTREVVESLNLFGSIV